MPLLALLLRPSSDSNAAVSSSSSHTPTSPISPVNARVFADRVRRHEWTPLDAPNQACCDEDEGEGEDDNAPPGSLGTVGPSPRAPAPRLAPVACAVNDCLRL